MVDETRNRSFMKGGVYLKNRLGEIAHGPNYPSEYHKISGGKYCLNKNFSRILVDEDEGSPYRNGVNPGKTGRKSRYQRKPSGYAITRFLSPPKLNEAYKNPGDRIDKIAENGDNQSLLRRIMNTLVFVREPDLLTITNLPISKNL